MLEMSMKELLGVIKADAKVDIKIENMDCVERSFGSHELSSSFVEYADRKVKTVSVGENNHLVVELYK